MILTIFTIFTSIVYGLNKGPSPFISLFWWIWNKIMSPKNFFLEIFIELISAVYVPNVAYILPISHSHPYIIKIKAICQSFQFGRNLKIWTSPHIKIVYILNCGRFDFRGWHCPLQFRGGHCPLQFFRITEILGLWKIIHLYFHKTFHIVEIFD